MRRMLSCVLMMSLLLCSCKAGVGEMTPDTAALAVRDTYGNLAGWSSTVDVTAEVGDKVFDFTLDAQWRREGETVLAITAPELLAGITARTAQGETVLEYDGAGLSLGLLDGDGLTPVSAATAFMEQIEKGWMAKCTWSGENGEQLQITFRDPELEADTGTQYLLTFDRAGGALLAAEVSTAGETVLTARISNFTSERSQNETGNNTHMG